MKVGRRIRLHLYVYLVSASFLLLSSCGVYSKTAPINPDKNHWEGPLLDQADMENVQIVLKPHERSITLNLEDLDADLSLLMQYFHSNRPDFIEEYVFQSTDAGNYTLVITKQ
ncbi:MAG: hypothetical protein EOM15_02065 [Spirochaetia bacterium]|nr:hypothetical protein [Spirochaetia bacterium]